MNINKIDDLFDNLLNRLYEYLFKNKIFDKFKKDTNFVKYQNEILEILKVFIEKTVVKKEIIDLVKNENYYEYILGIMKRYCMFYIYLGIAYNYTGNRDLFITNIIETGKNQKDATFSIPNFYNADNNAKLINAFIDIKNIQGFHNLTMDKVKIVINNNPLKFESTLRLFNELGEDYIIDNFLIPDNFHNLLKTFIFRQIYIKEDKEDLVSFLSEKEELEGEYRYIEIIQSNERKLIDYTLIQKFLSLQQLKSGLADDIYNYLVEMRESKDIIIKENKEFINYLFSNNILIPINEDFLRYHDKNELYDEKENNKIKFVTNKLNNVRNYYSPILEKNPKLKLETEKVILEPRKTVLFNENEELRLVQTLKNSDDPSAADSLIELENIRKYSFVNFKNFSKDGFKLRTKKTIESIRAVSLKKKKDEPLEIRIGHDDIDLALIGVAFNPSNMPLNCFTTGDLVNIHTISKSPNKFNIFIKTMDKFFDKQKNKKLYYWLFNTKTDLPKSDKYDDVNVNEPGNNIKLMIAQLYQNYIELVKYKYETYIKKLDEITLWNLKYLIRRYNKKYFDFNLNPKLKNELIEKTLKTRLKELEITIDDVDELIPGKRDVIIELPKVKLDTITKNIIKINFEEEDEIIIGKDNNEPICLHYVKWRNINRLSKLKSEEFSQSVVDFAKQYVKLSKTGDYICKSCSEELSIKKFIYEGTYVEELDTFMTTNIAVNQRLEEIPKYSNYLKTIKNLEKNIEKIAYSTDLNSYIGTSPTIRLRRKLVIKDVLDLILLHTDYLRKQPKSRIEEATKKYNIQKDFTNLFFFELKDEIFLTSSTDTDYYKLIKYNNVIVYLLFIIILELNPGQILNFKDDKSCNYFFYDKVGKTLFSNLFLRLNQKEKIAIEKIPLLCYSIYYFSCIFTNNRVWLWNEGTHTGTKEEINKKKHFSKINVQKTIINTLIDLINSIIEANFEEKTKNYFYEFLNTRFIQKITHTFNDATLLKRIHEKSASKVTYDDKTKKVSFLSKKIESLDISNNLVMDDLTQDNKKNCDVAISGLPLRKEDVDNTNLDLLTNCPDGKFHKWEFNKNDMVCSLCNQSYNELLKLHQTTSSDTNDNKAYLQKLKLFSLNKLAKKYCISGELHDLNNKGVCIKCDENPDSAKFSEKDLEKLEKNLEEKTYEEGIESIKQMKQHVEEEEKEKSKIKIIMDKFNKRYLTNTDNKIYSYISDFVDRLIKILGNKIKIKDDVIYLKDTVYILDHDYFGNARKETVYILSSENKVEIYKNHPYFKMDVLYYKDKANNVFVYYDIITFQYIGYSENNKEFKKTKSNASLKINYSVRDTILMLGIENRYVNLYHVNSQYQKRTPEKIAEDSQNIVNSYVRNRVSNLKQILSRSNSIINNIKNNGKFESNYGFEEKSLIDEFNKKIKHFKTRDEDGHNSIYKHLGIIFNNIGLNPIPENININITKHYFDTSTIDLLNNTDCKLIFYLLHGFNRLLDYNEQIGIQSELAYLLIRLIRFSFNQYFRPYSNSLIRKFDFILINETPYIDDNLKVVGLYQELLTTKEVDTKKEEDKDKNYDAQQATESMDVDDYEVNDDFDESMEAFDGNSGE